ncbi:MAG TPA: sulfotransferase [Kofleriaceae bacterium]
MTTDPGGPAPMRYMTLQLDVPEAKRDDYTRHAWSARSAGLIDAIEARLSPALVVHESSAARDRLTVRVVFGAPPGDGAEAAVQGIAGARGLAVTSLAIGEVALDDHRLFDRPIIILSAPRAGSTLLFELLSQLPGVWTVGGESLAIIESVPALTAASHGWKSGCLTAADAGDATVRTLLDRFIVLLRDRDGRMYVELARQDRPRQVRFLEKTPRNALRVPFLSAIFPDARFVFLHRDARENIASMIEMWQQPSSRPMYDLPGWSGPPWQMLLPPGWRGLDGRSVAEIAAFQWRAANEAILDALPALPPGSWHAESYADLTSDPAGTLERICAFAGAPRDARFAEVTGAGLPMSRSVISAPRRDKWRSHEPEIERVIPDVSQVIARLVSVRP